MTIAHQLGRGLLVQIDRDDAMKPSPFSSARTPARQRDKQPASHRDSRYFGEAETVRRPDGWYGDRPEPVPPPRPNPRNPGGVSHLDERYFSHPSTIGDTRDVPIEGHGPSGPSPSTQRLHGGPAIERDRQGHPAFSEGLTSASEHSADPIRRRTHRAAKQPIDPHHLGIAAEKRQYSRD
jgi:hypothetical protein